MVRYRILRTTYRNYGYGNRSCNCTRFREVGNFKRAYLFPRVTAVCERAYRTLKIVRVRYRRLYRTHRKDVERYRRAHRTHSMFGYGTGGCTSTRTGDTGTLNERARPDGYVMRGHIQNKQS